MADSHEHVTCQEVVELVTDYVEQMRATIDAEVPPLMRERLLAAFRDRGARDRQQTWLAERLGL
jgi:hypothetical protein